MVDVKNDVKKNVLNARYVHYPAECLNHLPFQTLFNLEAYLINKQATYFSKKRAQIFKDIIETDHDHYDEYTGTKSIYSEDLVFIYDNQKTVATMFTSNPHKNASILLSIYNMQLKEKEFKVKVFNKDEGFIDCIINEEGILLKNTLIRPSNIHNFYSTLVAGAMAIDKISGKYEKNFTTIAFIKSFPEAAEGKRRIKVVLYIGDEEQESFVVASPMSMAEAIRRTTKTFERFAGPFYMKKEKNRTFIGYKTETGQFIEEDEIIDRDIMYVSLLTNQPAVIRTKNGKIVLSDSSLKYMNQVFKVDLLGKIRMSFML